MEATPHAICIHGVVRTIRMLVAFCACVFFLVLGFKVAMRFFCLALNKTVLAFLGFST